mmetsp:Transcript_36928/g.33199  ORF Transcript_36928/g.33199 Transcript_36928/m.33199 type:complete len:98 (+) Transcript_36928:134-427(+)|eukprot:CAMPEP_0114594124 /NCGR_PEP_ID=MMETSP0125-20121206/15750_1 /TAXON_ID=485358 ORGANISM="Aristerostoma sp., Strain ATCC 50986" /NCGR_SAMPLE_ID=MMETSP0125 /ASSEMBLY_ACC=CAM_ASM_000245 /LENGTH=97 /DNA_ID=CAMNT_0001794053 /DNA_START=490 /DNA_END=783 /DNA_ORIENTATION=+
MCPKSKCKHKIDFEKLEQMRINYYTQHKKSMPPLQEIDNQKRGSINKPPLSEKKMSSFKQNFPHDDCCLCKKSSKEIDFSKAFINPPCGHVLCFDCV